MLIFLVLGCARHAPTAEPPSCLAVRSLGAPAEIPTPEAGMEPLGPGLFQWTAPEGDDGGSLYLGVEAADGSARMWEIGRSPGLFGGLRVSLAADTQGSPVWLTFDLGENTRANGYQGSRGSNERSHVLWDPAGARFLAILPVDRVSYTTPPWWCDNAGCPDAPDPEVDCSMCGADAFEDTLDASATLRRRGFRYSGSEGCPAGSWTWVHDGWRRAR